MAASTARLQRVQERVSEHVRRTVGLKVMRDLQRWAQEVERERRARPRLVMWLFVIAGVIELAVVLAAWLYYRGG